MCRNVLIYFQQDVVHELVEMMIKALSNEGTLILGKSESIENKFSQIESLGKSIYQRLPGWDGPHKEGTNSATDVHLKLSVNPKSKIDLIVIGASTGGPEALAEVLKDLPTNCPPVVVVQHISADYSKSLFLKLAQKSQLKNGTIESGTRLLRGHLYMPTDDCHLGVNFVPTAFCYKLIVDKETPPQNQHRPSVDYLFQSLVGNQVGSVMGILLTGMGKDGADGLCQLKARGAFTIAQDEASCVVFGMPKKAIEMGGVQFIGNLEEIRQKILKLSENK